MNRLSTLATTHASLVAAACGVLYGLFFIVGSIFLSSDLTELLLFVFGVVFTIVLVYVTLKSGHQLFASLRS